MLLLLLLRLLFVLVMMVMTVLLDISHVSSMILLLNIYYDPRLERDFTCKVWLLEGRTLFCKVKEANS